ncbi:MAG TPA: M1 family metallopeptidase [Acidobacteriota bacterium]
MICLGSTGSVLSLACLPLLAQLPEKADQVVDYRIQVRLDPQKKQLEGHEKLIWRNPSSDSVNDLWFHLYLNAFKNTKSTFYRESGGRLRGDVMGEDKWGWNDVTSLKLADGTDLTKSISFQHPDDDNADDQTVFKVRLPKPVAPGQTVELSIDFTAQLPQVFARSGYRGDFYLVGQWFPKLGVYESAGMRGRKQGGWNCHQYHATSEFYADYGHYWVEITVPSNFVVGATGRLRSRRENKKGAIYLYEQENVHDFAWTADPRFIEVERPFSADRDVSPEEYRAVAQLLGREEKQVRLSDVTVRLLMQPGHLSQADRYAHGAQLALKWFGLWYGRYPYSTLTVVDPAPGASGAGGMEYPTFITAGTSFLLSYWPFNKTRSPEFVTVHEAGHQWWYGLIGNNEFEEAWLDEGFNSYSTGKIMERNFETLIDFLGLRLGEIEFVRAQNGPFMKFDTIRKNSWSYLGSGNYAFYSYTKPELALRTLENHLGEQTMARIMRTYHERWRYRHPSTDDFIQVANEISGQNLNWFFDQVVSGSDILDYQVAQVSSEEINVDRGVFDRTTGRVIVDRKAAEHDEKAQKEKVYDSTVIVRRLGEVVFPVSVLIQFEKEKPIFKQWDGRDRWVRYKFTGPHPLQYAQIDPEHKVFLDVDWINNSLRREGTSKASAKWAARVLFWMQNLLALLSAIS